MLEMSEKTLVVQHNNLVEARYRLTVEEQRLIKTLVSQIQVNDEDFKVYEIRILDLTRLIGITDDYYYNKIKKLTKRLRDSSLCFTNENGDEVQTGWLSSAVYRKGKGIVELRFDPVLKPYLLQLKNLFTSYELGNILRLKGMYSIRIYELLKQYEPIGRREFSIEGLKQVLKIETEYQQYRDFKKFVLNPAQKEISEKTDIQYTTTEKTKGRKVIGLAFNIKGKKKRLTKEKPKEQANHNQFVDLLVNIGVTQRTAENMVNEYDGERIQAAIDYTEALRKEGKVNNPAGFVVEAIKNDYRDNQAEERERQEKALQEAKAREERVRRWEQIKGSHLQARKAAFEIWYSKLNEKEEEELRREYFETLPPMLKKLKNKGMVEKMFLGHLESLVSFPALREWAEQNYLDIAEFEEEIRREEAQALAQKPTSSEIAA
jgi:plasmid replication initiation protein